MNQEELLKKHKKDELIKRVMMLEEKLAEYESDLDTLEAELKVKSAKLTVLEEYKKEVGNWSFGLVKTLLENEDKRKLFVSELEENINEIIDARVQEKLVTKTFYYDNERYVDVFYDGNAV